MQGNQSVRTVIIVLLVCVIIGGVYALVRPPAPKPLPEETAPPTPVAPVPGEPLLDMGKYRTEPTISIWVAEKGQTISLPLETYLEGVIAQEMDPQWPVQALAAQAIVARTLTLHAMETGTIRRLHKTDVSTNKDELQAYAPEKVNANVKQAVAMSRGIVLLYGGSLINAVYSSCNGQISATKDESFPREIANDAPYFKVEADNCFQYAPASERDWTVKIPGQEVVSAVGYQGNPADIQILQKGPSGRILFIGAGDKKIYGSEFRKSVGYDRLKSTLINEMTYDGADFTFKGQGWGNGAGLCQWGAYTYAVMGWTAGDIIGHYYKDVTAEKLWK